MANKRRMLPINKVGPSDEDSDHGEFIMPSLPTKFTFNQKYVGPFKQVDHSLKAIFSKNANAV